MSTKHTRTAGDLVRFGLWLKITCDRCGNAQTVQGIEVVKVAGNQDLERFRKRLKCSLCGAREVTLGRIKPPPAQ